MSASNDLSGAGGAKVVPIKAVPRETRTALQPILAPIPISVIGHRFNTLWGVQMIIGQGLMTASVEMTPAAARALAVDLADIADLIEYDWPEGEAAQGEALQPFPGDAR